MDQAAEMKTPYSLENQGHRHLFLVMEKFHCQKCFQGKEQFRHSASPLFSAPFQDPKDWSSRTKTTAYSLARSQMEGATQKTSLSSQTRDLGVRSGMGVRSSRLSSLLNSSQNKEVVGSYYFPFPTQTSDRHIPAVELSLTSWSPGRVKGWQRIQTFILQGETLLRVTSTVLEVSYFFSWSTIFVLGETVGTSVCSWFLLEELQFFRQKYMPVCNPSTCKSHYIRAEIL